MIIITMVGKFPFFPSDIDLYFHTLAWPEQVSIENTALLISVNALQVIVTMDQGLRVRAVFYLNNYHNIKVYSRVTCSVLPWAITATPGECTVVHV